MVTSEKTLSLKDWMNYSFKQKHYKHLLDLDINEKVLRSQEKVQRTPSVRNRAAGFAEGKVKRNPSGPF